MRPFIYRNGYPGFGKLTVAEELSKLIPLSKVFDNHLLIDPVAAIFERDMEEYQPLHRQLRRNCLAVISGSTSTKEITWIFTDAMASNPEGAAAARDYQQGAASRNSPFFSVVLSCGLEENLRRVQTAGRGGATNTKLTDVDIVCNIREMEDIYHFKDQNELDLDVTEILPTEAAQRILDHIAEIHECQ